MLRMLLLLTCALTNATDPDPALERARKLVQQMTLPEKLKMLQGDSANKNGYTGVTDGVSRLGVPDLRMNDGPQGFRADSPGTSTQWPSGLTVAHSWDVANFDAYGAALGDEFHRKGANVLFGPAVNVARIANGGRSFEYLSGEVHFLRRS